MNRISVPILITNKNVNYAYLLPLWKQEGMDLVLLAIPPISTEKDVQEAIYALLSDCMEKVRSYGLQVGVWFWGLTVSDGGAFARVEGFETTSATICCPLDDGLRQLMQTTVMRVGQMHPDVILLDDDVRLGWLDSGFGCLCAKHRLRIEKKLGQSLPHENLFSFFFSGGESPQRTAFLDAMGESLEDYAFSLRRALDTVAPDVRMGLCACLSHADTDGTSSFRLARLLAGNTKPFLRLIGAPYWASSEWFPQVKLADSIETIRMQAAWPETEGIEMYAEGDTFPRPRFTCSSSELELYHTALICEKTVDGIQKYIADYFGSESYETGYLDAHIRGAGMRNSVKTAFSDKADTGIRIYEFPDRLRRADVTDSQPTQASLQQFFFSRAAVALSSHGLPSVYTGEGVCGICFGENARFLPADALDRPLILDLKAARLLAERGIDVGLYGIGDSYRPVSADFPAYRESVFLMETQATAHMLSLAKEARPIGRLLRGEEGAFAASNETLPSSPYAYAYRHFLVFAFEAETVAPYMTRNYIFPRLISDFLAEQNVRLPAYLAGCPDVYIRAAENQTETAVAVFNFSKDTLHHALLSASASEVLQAVGVQVEKTGNGLYLTELPAYRACLLTLKKE